MNAMNLPHFPSHEWEALARLFERAYFCRIWIVRELVVSSNAVVRCGSCKFSGGRVPFILGGEGSGFRLVGESYVHGLMEGQSINNGVEV